MGRIALIDGDVVAYRCASSCIRGKKQIAEAEANGLPRPLDDNLGIALARTAELMDRILSSVQTTQYRIFLSGSENFRKLIYPDYKRNRDDLPRPEHLDPLRDFLVREWGAEVCAGYEADDGIGIAAHGDFVIVSNDKDFRQIPGQLFNFVTDTHEIISPETATVAFWAHMLIGDTSDNVRGVDGLGKVKGPAALEGLDAEGMASRVRNLYNDDERFFLNVRLLRILRSEEEWLDLETAIREGQRPWATEEGSRYDIANLSRTGAR